MGSSACDRVLNWSNEGLGTHQFLIGRRSHFLLARFGASRLVRLPNCRHCTGGLCACIIPKRESVTRGWGLCVGLHFRSMRRTAWAQGLAIGSGYTLFCRSSCVLAAVNPLPLLLRGQLPLSEQCEALFPQLLEPWDSGVPFSGGP